MIYPVHIYDMADNQWENMIVAHVEFKANAPSNGIWLSADGYGAADEEPGDCGAFAKLEFYDGKLKLVVWADINDENPTHNIDLSGAMESNREEE